MNLIILQPIRWQLSLAALLALVCAVTSGVYLSTFPSDSPGLMARAHRPLPLRPTTVETDTHLKQQMAGLLQEKQQVEVQLQIRDSEWQQLKTRVTAAQQHAMSLNIENSPEKLAVLKLRQQPPRWEALDLSPADVAILAQVWDSNSTQVDRAVAILENNRQAWHTKATTAVTAGTTERQQRQAMLRDLKARFDKESAAVASVLVVDDLGIEKTAPLLTAIRKIIEMFGGSRAVVGMNFTNSVGMEMVWMPDGGFWLGRAEITSAAYKAVKGAGGGDENPAEGISWNEAYEFCEALNKREAQYEGNLPPGRSLRPNQATYTLPSFRQWRLGREQEESLGLQGFSNGLSEWSRDQQKSGFATQTIVGGAASSWFLALNGQSAVALPPTTRSSIVQSGTATKATGKAGTIEIWSGRLGLRVILVPTKSE